MTEVVSASADPKTSASPGLPARVFGVLLSPRDTYAAVAARPRSLGVLAVVLTVVILAQGVFLSTEVGQQAVLDQQVRTMEAFGITLPDEAYAQMEASVERAPLTGGISALVFWPLMMAIIAGLLTGVFTMLLGGAATFKHVFAVVAHSSVVIVVQQLFSMPLSYARGEFASANLGVFVPMLEETSFLATFLSAIDLFMVWWAVNVAIGVGVLYKRRTGAIANSLLAIYVVIALIYAVWRSGS